MMLLVVLLNGIVHITLAYLMFLYVHNYRGLMSQIKVFLFSSFGTYYLFSGFLRVRYYIEPETFMPLLEDGFHILNFMNLITSISAMVVYYTTIMFKGNITK